MGPKIALVPFLEKTKNFDAETQRLRSPTLPSS